jgi:hypothetical protein
MVDRADSILIATSPGGVSLTPIERLGVGFAAGTLARTLTSPLDVIKMLMQVSSKGGSFTEILTKLYREDGVAGFWRGNFAACVRVGPQSAIKFYAQEEIQKIVGPNPSGVQRAVVGASAGLIAQMLTYPLDVVRTRITVDPKRYSSVFGSMYTIATEEGVLSLFAGMGTTAIGAAPYEGAKYYAFETIKDVYRSRIAPGKPISPWATCVMGATAEAFAQIFSTPIDLVRKRSMLRDENGKPLANGLVDGLVKTVAKDGPLGLYRGFSLGLVKSLPFAALQFMFKEEFGKFALSLKTGAAVPKGK